MEFIMPNSTDQTRRDFLKKITIMAGGTSLLATQSKLQLINSALAADYSGVQDYKSLVCIFLAGGNDSLNMFPPYETTAYQNYQNTRQGLAIPRDQLLPISDNSRAFHPSMGAVRDLYDQSRLCVLGNVGNLLQPLNRAQFLAAQASDSSIRVPQGLFSHSHQQEIWQTYRTPAVSTPPGWGGLLADLLNSANGASELPPTTSLTGNNLWQTGQSTQPFKINGSGIRNFEYLRQGTWPAWQSSRIDTWEDILALNSNHVLEQQMASSFLTTQRRITLLQEALSSAPEIQTEYPSPNVNNLANNLRMVARLISAREALGLKRQIFFIQYGPWDTHSDQLSDHANLLATLNEAMHAFYQTTVELRVADTVTTFTASEFGRTATSNGDGTDHGWGGDQLIMGGAVSGESLFLRKLVLGIPAQASGKNLTRPLLPSAPQPSCVRVTSPHHRKLGAGYVPLPQMTGRCFGKPFILFPPTLALRFRQNNGPTPSGDYQPSRSLSMAGSGCLGLRFFHFVRSSYTS